MTRNYLFNHQYLADFVSMVKGYLNQDNDGCVMDDEYVIKFANNVLLNYFKQPLAFENIYDSAFTETIKPVISFIESTIFRFGRDTEVTPVDLRILNPSGSFIVICIDIKKDDRLWHRAQ